MTLTYENQETIGTAEDRPHQIMEGQGPQSQIIMEGNLTDPKTAEW
jgi:hypothetical protein